MHLARVCDGNSGEPLLALALQDLLDGVVGAQDVGVEHEAVLVLLHLPHKLCLILGQAAVVDDSDACEDKL